MVGRAPSGGLRLREKHAERHACHGLTERREPRLVLWLRLKGRQRLKGRKQGLIGIVITTAIVMPVWLWQRLGSGRKGDPVVGVVTRQWLWIILLGVHVSADILGNGAAFEDMFLHCIPHAPQTFAYTSQCMCCGVERPFYRSVSEGCPGCKRTMEGGLSLCRNQCLVCYKHLHLLTSGQEDLSWEEENTIH